MPDSPNPDPKNIRQNVDDMRGGNVIGEQHNYYTPPSNPAPPRKSGFPWGTLFQVLVAVLGLLLAFLALYPEDSRTELFRNLGLLPVPTATLTPTPVPTETATPTLAPSETPLSTETFALTVTNIATDLPMATQTPTSTETPALTDTPLPTVIITTSPSDAVQAYPCSAIVNVSTRSQIVRTQPRSNSTALGWVDPGQEVIVLEVYPQGTRINWYRITDQDDQPIGWIEDRYLILSDTCPN